MQLNCAAEVMTSPESARVLVVDDEQMIRRATKRMVERMGFAVSLAEDGDSALRIFERERESISLILLDMVMPGMCGDKVFEELTKIDPDVRVILVSGYSEDGEVEALVRRGVKAFVQKPYDPETFSEAIKTALQ